MTMEQRDVSTRVAMVANTEWSGKWNLLVLAKSHLQTEVASRYSSERRGTANPRDKANLPSKMNLGVGCIDDGTRSMAFRHPQAT